MSSGGRRSAGERVLESKHVIGLFLLMLVFSGVFFTLGYVMGRNQYDGQVRAASPNARSPEPAVASKPASPAKKSVGTTNTENESDPATATAEKSDWEFYHSNAPAKPEPHLQPASKVPAAAAPAKPLVVKSKSEQPPAPLPVKSTKTPVTTPLIPSGAFLLQVAAVTKQDDALTIASSLQKKHFPATVLTPQKDSFYRVQVGPYKDQKAAEAAKKGLESAGFKAFYVKH